MKIQLKRSNVIEGGAAKEPTSTQMEYGELAVNYNNGDPAIFLKDSNDNIIRIAGAGAINNIEIPEVGDGPHQPNTLDDRYVEVTGDAMTGQLTLPGGGGDTEALQKQEIQALIDDADANVIIGSTPPLNPTTGDLWYNSDDGRLYVYYTDVDSSQWVDASPDGGGPGSGGASVTISDTAPTDAEQGNLWWNTTDARLYIWYEDSDTSQWVDASPDNDREVLWERTGTTLSPANAGDDIETTGNVSAANVVATGDVQSSSQNGGHLAGFRNQIMNGSFIVRQRMPVQTPTNYNDNDFVEDRWAISSDNSSEINGVEVTVQDSNSGPLNQRSVLRVRQGTATATTAKLIQHIELNTQGDQFPFQVGTQWTLSFWYSGATDFTTQSCRAIFRTGGGISNNQLLAAPNDTGFVTQTDGSWNKYVFTFTIDGDMSVDPNQASFTCLDIVINNFDITALSAFTDIQFEPGPVATPFEHRPIGVELSLCQRFYQIRTSGTTDPLNLRPTMRTTPTVSGNSYDAEL